MGVTKSRGLLFIVSAPSGAGKTTLCKRLTAMMPGLSHSVSHTTRRPRPGEADGEHYYFVSEEEFGRMVKEGSFVEWAKVHGNRYGTSRAELERLFGMGKDVIMDIDTQGAGQIRDSGAGGVFIFVLPPSPEELAKRLRERETDDEQEITRRLEVAAGEIKSYSMYDYVIVNDEFEQALVELGSVVTAEKCRVKNIDEGLLKRRFGLV